MRHLFTLAVTLSLTAILSAADSFYKQPPLFSTAPKEELSSQFVGRFGPVGIGIELVQPAFTMKVSNLEQGSPAEVTGKLKVGQFIESINGQKLAEIDPRIQLGNIITAAEATDGAVKLLVKDTPDSAAQEVVVKIPVLGSYSKTWPLNCPKSDNIVRNFAEYLARPGSHQGFSGIGMLFLLSTGEERDIMPVKAWVHSYIGKPAPTYAWHLGYGGIPLCEYYLRTGDPVALPIIQSWVTSAAKAEYLDAWAGRGGVTDVDYGNGHLNAGGTAVVTFLLLAKECGAEVNESLLQRTLRHFYRFAGRGNNPYGDDRPEGSMVDNGKNGNLAFAMAAAAALTPDGERSIYAAARDTCAMTGFYTTTYMLHGHTGGGIGEAWRSTAMGLLYDKKPIQYREFMNNRQWHYELSRRFNGSFGILGGDESPKGGHYDNEEWGAQYALTYTIPRKKLRVAGAPPTKFSKRHKLPDRPWGTAGDDTFLSLEAAIDKTGRRQDLSQETLQHDSGKPLIDRLAALKEVSDDLLRQYVHHQDHMLRQLAANHTLGINFHYMAVTAGARIRSDLALEFAASHDPRVRSAAFRAFSNRFDPQFPWAKNVFALAIERLRDPEESWWIKDACLYIVGRAPADWIAPHMDLLIPFLKHEEQWLQNGALVALLPVVADERCYQKVMPAFGELLRNCQRVSTIGPVRSGAMLQKLATASPAVQKLAAQTLQGTFANYSGVKTAAGGQNITSVYNSHKKFLASYLVGVEGGYDVLYEVAKQEAPHDPLPYRDIFLTADPEKFGPRLKQVIVPIIRDQLIYEQIGRNRARLLAEINPAKPAYGPAGALDELVALYRKIGVHDYDWHVFGDLKDAAWDYHTFDPPEKQAYDFSPWRYRQVTYPAGMETWFTPDFDPANAGWKKGQGPFGQLEGKLVTDTTERRNPDCRATGPMRTLWNKEVLLARGTFQLPPLKPGHLYRVRMESGQHVGSGDGYKLFINGHIVEEVKEGVGRNAGGRARGPVINAAFAAEFAKGPVTIAATSFLRYGDRAIVTMPAVPRGLLAIWIEEMKIPPIDDEAVRKSATVIPMLSSSWQAKQDPNNNEPQATDERFKYDGKFTANPRLLGSWKAVDVVPFSDEFVPPVAPSSDPASKRAAAIADEKRAVAVRNSPLKAVTFRDGGLTDSGTLIWTGDKLLDLDQFQMLQIVPKTIDSTDYLFIETGGFSDKHPAGWRSPWVVLKRM